MRLPSTTPGVIRRHHTQTPQQAAGAVTPSLTGDCYDNADCKNSWLPGKGRVQRDITVDACKALVGDNGAWKAQIEFYQPEGCFSMATDYAGLKQREQLRVGKFF